MRIYSALFVFVLLMANGSTLQSKEASAFDVQNSLFCLTRGKNPVLNLAKSGRYQVHSLVDATSYSGQTHVLIIFRRLSNLFDIFDIAVSSEPKRRYRLVNNASIETTSRGAEFQTEPLGGLWTQNFIRRSFSIAMKRRSRTYSAGIQSGGKGICQSFVDS
jgi:hypothetical protein